MLPTENRLRRRRDFKHLYQTGKTLNAGLFRIKTAPNKQEVTRIGVVVPNKIIRGAVDRNKIKRRVRAATHEILPFLRTGMDIAIIATPDLQQASFIDIKTGLVKAFKKIGFWAENGDAT